MLQAKIQAQMAAAMGGVAVVTAPPPQSTMGGFSANMMGMGAAAAVKGLHLMGGPAMAGNMRPPLRPTRSPVTQRVLCCVGSWLTRPRRQSNDRPR